MRFMPPEPLPPPLDAAACESVAGRLFPFVAAASPCCRLVLAGGWPSEPRAVVGVGRRHVVHERLNQDDLARWAEELANMRADMNLEVRQTQKGGGIVDKKDQMGLGLRCAIWVSARGRHPRPRRA